MKYVSFDTQSSEETGVTPSTPGQMVFAHYLKEELESMGLEEITLDENGYLFATLPANTDKPLPTVGFIAHMDTSPDMSGKNVSPRKVENYDGKDIPLTGVPELKKGFRYDMNISSLSCSTIRERICS